MLEVADLGLEFVDLHLELADVAGQRGDGAMLLVGVRGAVKSLLTEGLFKEPEESARPSQPSLIDRGIARGKFGGVSAPLPAEKARHQERER